MIGAKITRAMPRPMSLMIASGVVATGLFVAPAVAGAAAGHGATAAAAPRPNIASVTFSGTSGPGVASPTVTVLGSSFGTTAPPGTGDNNTSCGHYTNNGKVYKNRLYFADDANFEAGYRNSSGADCIGLVVTLWSPTKVVFQFGSAYGSFAHWYLSNGDGYAMSMKHAIWGGAVSGLTP